jgi:toxin FitB
VNGFLLDTMVVSEGTKRHPDAKVAQWLQEHPVDVCYLSVLTIGEIQFGIARLPPSPRRSELADWLNHQLFSEFRSRIIPFDLTVALAWGEIVAVSERRRIALPTVDAQIGATSKAHELTLVTRNTHHFTDMGVDLVDPWR